MRHLTSSPVSCFDFPVMRAETLNGSILVDYWLPVIWCLETTPRLLQLVVDFPL